MGVTLSAAKGLRFRTYLLLNTAKIRL